MPDKHIVYAVVDRGHTVRVSDPFANWHDCVNRWAQLDRERRLDFTFKVAGTDSGVTAARMPVRFFAVRSTSDPDWPQSSPLSTVRLNGRAI